MDTPEKSDAHKQENSERERDKCIITTYADLENVGLTSGTSRGIGRKKSQTKE